MALPVACATLQTLALKGGIFSGLSNDPIDFMNDILEKNWQRISIFVGGVLFGFLAHNLRSIDVVENLYISLNSWKIYYCSIILIGMFVPSGLILFCLNRKYKRVERDMETIQSEIEKVEQEMGDQLNACNKNVENGGSNHISRQAWLKAEWQRLNEKHTRLFLWIYGG